MKRISLLLTGLFLLCCYVGAQNEKISFNETEHNFGDIGEKDGNASFDFVISNRSKAPIVISKVTASCGCTTPVWTREPIENGKTGTISVSYNPLGRIGPFSKVITVYVDQATPIYLKIKGNVMSEELAKKKADPEQTYPVSVGAYLLKTSELIFGQVDGKAAKTMQIEVYNNSDKPITHKALKLPKYMTATFNPAILPAKTAGTIDVILNAQDNNLYGDVSGEIVLMINDTRKSLTYSATVQEDFSKWTAKQKADAGKININISVINFGSFKSGNSRTLKMSNSGKSDLNIYTIQSSNPLVTVSKPHLVISPGEIAEIKVIVDNKKINSKLSSTLTIISNDPNTPAYEITVLAEPNKRT